MKFEKKNTSNMPKIWHEMKLRNSLLYSGIILNRRQVLDSINGVLKVKILRDQTKKICVDVWMYKNRLCLKHLHENYYIGTFYRQKFSKENRYRQYLLVTNSIYSKYLF